MIKRNTTKIRSPALDEFPELERPGRIPVNVNYGRSVAFVPVARQVAIRCGEEPTGKRKQGYPTTNLTDSRVAQLPYAGNASFRGGGHEY